MISITRQFGFDAGHRVLGHESKCANLHGHRYLAEVTVEGPKLDHLGRVIDFSVLKTKVGSWIDDHWDHTMILHEDDPLLSIQTHNSVIFGPKRPYVMPNGMNPTAENLAQVLATMAQIHIEAHSLKVIRVRLWETPNCYADWEIEQ